MKKVILIGLLFASLLAACGGSSTASLVGPTWTVTSLSGATLVPDAKITAVFSGDGHMSGSGGCNTYSAGYKVSGSTLTISSPNATMMSCSMPVDQQESNYFYLLEAAGSYEIKGSDLTIKASTGETILKYTSTQ